MTGSKAEVERAVAAMIAEQRAHGTSEQDIKQLIHQLKIIADEVETESKIPD